MNYNKRMILSVYQNGVLVTESSLPWLCVVLQC